MPIAQKTETNCRRCGDNSDVWRSEKEEPTITKVQFTCEACGCEWTERRQE
jgi:DNA-directed RNA polymerase subunit M/transcription elongation factor TFIIS